MAVVCTAAYQGMVVIADAVEKGVYALCCVAGSLFLDGRAYAHQGKGDVKGSL